MCVCTFPNVMEGLTRETPSAVGMGSPTLPYSKGGVGTAHGLVMMGDEPTDY